MKPLIFIILVLIAPGTDSAIFYYNTSILKFNKTQMSNITLMGQLGAIFGQQFYSLTRLKNLGFKRIMIIATCLYSVNEALKLVSIIDEGQLLKNPIWFVYFNSFAYSCINSVHLMPIMVYACNICPKSVEATFYSFILALINVGYLLSY